MIILGFNSNLGKLPSVEVPEDPGMASVSGGPCPTPWHTSLTGCNKQATKAQFHVLSCLLSNPSEGYGGCDGGEVAAPLHGYMLPSCRVGLNTLKENILVITGACNH